MIHSSDINAHFKTLCLFSTLHSKTQACGRTGLSNRNICCLLAGLLEAKLEGYTHLTSKHILIHFV